MNYLRYDPDTGVIREIGWSEVSSVEAEIASGSHLLIHDGSVQLTGWRVNLTTLQPEQISVQ